MPNSDQHSNYQNGFMVATKENSLEKDTLSYSLSGTVRIWSFTGRHSTNLVSLNVSPLNFENLLSWIIKTWPQLDMLVSLVLSRNSEHWGQDHICSPDRGSGLRLSFRDEEIWLNVGKIRISDLSSLIEEQKHVLQVTVVRKVIGRTFSTKDESPFNSSSTTPSISGTSCWLLKLKGSLRIDDILHCRALKQFVGSTAYIIPI